MTALGPATTAMRFAVETWAPEYGAPTEPEQSEPATPPDVSVEMSVDGWQPIMPSAGQEPSGILFIDGVRRVDASIWIDDPVVGPTLGLCATYAAGAVHCNGLAAIIDAKVEHSLFTSAPSAQAIDTRYATYQPRLTSGTTPPELWLGIQRRMADLEARVTSGIDIEGLVIVDGPLSHHGRIVGAIGYVKTQHTQYLPEELRWMFSAMGAGRRTPLFLIGGSRQTFSFYLRLASMPGPLGGIVRCEVAADMSVTDAVRLADRVSVALPTFASVEHKDPRAPQNLSPIGGLERNLRHRLGDQRLLFRGLRAAAHHQ